MFHFLTNESYEPMWNISDTFQLIILILFCMFAHFFLIQKYQNCKTHLFLMFSGSNIDTTASVMFSRYLRFIFAFRPLFYHFTRHFDIRIQKAVTDYGNYLIIIIDEIQSPRKKTPSFYISDIFINVIVKLNCYTTITATINWYYI